MCVQCSRALNFDVSPQNSQTVVEGATVTLYRTVSGGRPPFVYRWWHGSDPISPHEIPYGSSVLFLERINFSQSGDYSCSVASNGGAGFVNKTAYLKVLGGYLLLLQKYSRCTCISSISYVYSSLLFDSPSLTHSLTLFPNSFFASSFLSFLFNVQLPLPMSP